MTGDSTNDHGALFVLRRGRHLARRFVTSLPGRRPGADEVAWAHRHLSPSERELWDRMDPRDQRHTLTVARGFLERRPDATRDEVAGSLLHDIGKLASDLGTFGRVAARLVGPRTARLRVYLDHEPIGAEMLAGAGSSDVTIGMVAGTDTPAMKHLRAADDAS